MSELWPAPQADGPVRGVASIPGSKSLTNRFLVLAALASAPSRLQRPLRARDTQLMTSALRALGGGIDDDGDALVVTPASLRGPAQVDCGLAGTLMRFVPPLAVLADGPVSFDGDVQARTRPLSVLLNALRTLGADIDDGGSGRLPFLVNGSGSFPGGSVLVDASGSSQFVSGLLLSGARYDKGVVVQHDGDAIPSRPHIDMTVESLRRAGVDVDDHEPGVWRVHPGPVNGFDVAIEPDLSNAAPFLAAALVTGGEVLVPGWPAHTTQAGDRLRALLAEFGAECSIGADGLRVRGGATLRGVDVDLREAGELTPVVAALAALADSPSHLRGIGHIRGHETDRLAALATEINNLGGDVTATGDGLEIRPRQLRGGVFRSYADHRMAQAAAVLGLVVPGVHVDDIGSTTKTLPDFVGMWNRLLAGIVTA